MARPITASVIRMAVVGTSGAVAMKKMTVAASKAMSPYRNRVARRLRPL
jgi:hypothetical protein